MNNYLKLTNRDGVRFLFDTVTGWEIYDKGAEPAHWFNNKEGRSIFVRETFEQMLNQLGLAWDEPQETSAEQKLQQVKVMLQEVETFEIDDQGEVIDVAEIEKIINFIGGE